MVLSDEFAVILKMKQLRQFQADSAKAAGSVKQTASSIDTAGKNADRASRRTALFRKSILAVGKAALYTSALLAGAFVYSVIAGMNALVRLNQIGAQTSAVIKSTGGAANVTKDHVDKLAKRLERLSSMEQEVITEGANMLLTFTKIQNRAGRGNKIFDKSVVTLTDMAVALGKSPKVAAIALGKALNDPIKGITALGRVGVQFSERQKKVITSMTKANNIAGAQKVILKELNREFGGSAKALGDSTIGQWEKFKNAVGDLQEELAEKLAPTLNRGIKWVRKFTEQAVDSTGQGGRFRDRIVAIAKGAGQLFTVLGKVAGAVGDWAGAFNRSEPGAVAIGAAIGFIVTGLIAMSIISSVAKGVIAFNLAVSLFPGAIWITAIIAVVGALVVLYTRVGWFRNAVNAVFSFIKSNWPLLVGILFGPIAAAVAMIIAHWSTLMSFFRNAPGKIAGFFSDLPGKLGSMGIAAGKALANGLIDMINSAINSINSTLSFSVEVGVGPATKTFSVDPPDIGTIPHLARGGVARRGGYALVGERAPEILSMPTGARVDPLPPGQIDLSQLGGGGQPIVTKVYLDRRQIAEAVSDYASDRGARR